MELEQAIKLFVGGVTHDTNEQTLRGYFSKYGEVKSSEILRDRITGIPRGFGFIIFADNSVIDHVLNDNHVILGKKVEVKVAKPKGFREPSFETGEASNKKIFVGGTPVDLTTEELKSYFEKYGCVTFAEVRHPKGFGFVAFESEEAAKNALKTRFQYLKNKRVEVKVAEAPKPKGGGGGGGYNMCGKCGVSIIASSSYFLTIPPYGYGYNMPPHHFCVYVTAIPNEWQGGFNYISSLSPYHDKMMSNFVGQSPYIYSKPVSIRPPPERVERNENDNADKIVLAEVVEEKELTIAENGQGAMEERATHDSFEVRRQLKFLL